MFELHRRGYIRVATTANCGLPAGQYDVALVDWRQRSIKALETTLDWLVDFLSPTACSSSGSTRRNAPATESFAPCWRGTACSSRRAPSASTAPPFRRSDCDANPLSKVA